MQTRILSNDQAKAKVREYLESKQWWLFLEPDPGGWTTAIETRFYKGKANVDFEVIMGVNIPGIHGIIGLCFGRKSRLSPKRLAAWLSKQMQGYTVTEADLKVTDVLVIGDSTPEEAFAWGAIIGGWAGIP